MVVYKKEKGYMELQVRYLVDFKDRRQLRQDLCHQWLTFQSQIKSYKKIKTANNINNLLKMIMSYLSLILLCLFRMKIGDFKRGRKKG